MVVDLGCGVVKRGDIGVDLTALPTVDIVCHLGFEPIPLPDESVDEVVAYDFLEHLPGPVAYREDQEWKIHHPRIYLLREVYRILKPGGTFFSSTPFLNHVEWAQDPTHAAPPWTTRTFDYFCGAYPQGHAQYGIDFTFQMVSLVEHGPHLHVLMRRPKPVQTDVATEATEATEATLETVPPLAEERKDPDMV